MHSHWRKADQLFVLYVSRLLSSKPVLLCFKRRLKGKKPHPKRHSENTAKLTQTPFPSCEPSISTLESRDTSCMVIPCRNHKLSCILVLSRAFFFWQDSKDIVLSSEICNSSCSFCTHVQNWSIIAHILLSNNSCQWGVFTIFWQLYILMKWEDSCWAIWLWEQ